MPVCPHLLTYLSFLVHKYWVLGGQHLYLAAKKAAELIREDVQRGPLQLASLTHFQCTVLKQSCKYTTRLLIAGGHQEQQSSVAPLSLADLASLYVELRPEHPSRNDAFSTAYFAAGMTRPPSETVAQQV
jgi:hypothetical protein